MRVTSIVSRPLYISYCGKSGRTLNLNESTPDMPFGSLLNPLVLTDVDQGRVKLTLSDSDRAFMAKIMAADAKPLALPAPVVKKATPKPVIPMNKGGATGQPDFGPAPELNPVEAAKAERASAIPIMNPGKPMSLSDLNVINTGIRKQVKKAVPKPAIPMNPGGATGQPMF